MLFRPAPKLKALVITSLHQPLRQCARLAQSRQICKQVEAYRLENVGRIVEQAKLDRNRKDQVLVLIHEPRPGLLIAFHAFGYQAIVRP